MSGPVAVIVSMIAKSDARGDFVFGSRIRFSEYTTSSAVIARPLWNFTFPRSVNVHTSPSGDVCHDVARPGTIRTVGSTCTSVS